MKKWLKLWIAALSLLWVFAISVSWTNKAEAAKKITVTLSWSTISDSCQDIADYTFTWQASLTEQTLAEKSNNLTCTFAKTWAQSVTIQTTWLAWPMNVPAANILLTTSSTCSSVTWSIASSTCKAFSAVGLDAAKTVMSKAQNTIGTAVHAIKIKVKMPAWAPEWEYNWTLTVTWP